MKTLRVIGTVFFTIFFGLPLFWLVATSLKQEIEIGGNDLIWFPGKPDWANYSEAVGRSGILLAAWNSLWLSTVSAFITTAVTAPAAYLVAQSRGWFS